MAIGTGSGAPTGGTHRKGAKPPAALYHESFAAYAALERRRRADARRAAMAAGRRTWLHGHRAR